MRGFLHKRTYTPAFFGRPLTFTDTEITTASAEPDVTIRQDGDRIIEEYRVNGFLYAIKVTPKNGKPYFLVRADETGNFIRSDQPDMLIPQWEIFSW